MKVLVTEATLNAPNALIRALAAANYTVIGSDHRRLAFAAHSRHTPVYLPTPGLQAPGYADAVLQHVARQQVDIVLPGNQIEPFVVERERFAALAGLLVPDLPAWSAAYYNDRTLASCHQLGVACPQLFDAAQARDYLAEDDSHKVMIKPRADLGGGQGLQLVRDTAQLERALETLDLETYFIQEFIPGPVENMRSVALLYDTNSQLQLYFTSHKLRQWPLDGGICALGRSTDEPALVEYIAPFFARWRWQGVAEVEIKIDARDGQPKLIEINPRFWGNSNFAIQAGVNFPVAVCKLLQGEAVEQPRYATGFNYINWSRYLRCVGSDVIHAPDRGAAMREFGANLGRPRARNLDWRDWRLTLAKTSMELRAALD